jgi:hypothetical protein
MGSKFGVTANEYKAINIKNKNYEMGTYFLGIDIMARMTSRKASVKKKAIPFGIPSPRSLLKAVERFLKATKKARVISNIARRLLHVNFFLQIPMQEGRFSINLMSLPFI